MKLTYLSLFLTLSCASVGEYSKSKENFKEITGQNLASYSERRDSFLTKSENRINDIAVDLTKMKNDSVSLNKDEKSKAIFSIRETRHILKNVRKEFKKLSKAKAYNWENEKNKFLSVMNVLDENFVETRKYFN